MGTESPVEQPLKDVQSRSKGDRPRWLLLIVVFGVVGSFSLLVRSARQQKQIKPTEVAPSHEAEAAVDNDEGEEEPYERGYSLEEFDDLMSKFDETASNSCSIEPKCLDKPQRTRPTMFLSLGRSGSTVILQRLNIMTNSQSNTVSAEYVGQNPTENLYFFDTTIPVEEKFVESDTNHIPSILKKLHAEKEDVPGLNNAEHGEWLVNYFCRLQQGLPNDLVGFKWKTNFEQFVMRTEARETLQLVASLAAKAPKDQPPIAVVRSRRNMLDVQLSNLKHYQNKGLNPHCTKEDEACLDEHKHALLVHDVPEFYTNVYLKWQYENIIDELLLTLEIPHVYVTYDTLFYPDKIVDGEDEWNDMLQMISPGAPRESWDEIQDAMPFASTSLSRNHMEIIENGEEVYDVFRGTEVEHLFRLSD